MSQMMKSDKPRSSSQLTLSKLEEMKVSELKEELKFRRLKVTGTKEVLVERLKPFCVDSENPFLADLQIGDDNSSTGAYVTAGSPTTMNDVTFQAVAQENHAMQPIITQGITLSPNNSEQVGSNDAGPSTAFTIDPNTVFTHRVARMPIPEQHKIVLKQEKFTMPTWHSNIQDARVVTMVTSHAPTTSFSFPEAVDVNKDKLLEKQQKEINDLRRMVELHRSQLIKLQEHQSPELEGQQSENLQQQLQQQQQAFEFSQAAINNHRSQPAVQFCSSNPSTARQTSTASQPYNSPPNYDQAYEMMSEGDSRNHHQHENVNRQMDDLLELLADNGELPSTPVVTRQRLNDHSSYQGLNESTMRHRHHHGYAHQQQQHSQLPSNEYGSVIAQERAQLQQEIAQQQQQKSYSHRGSRDFASPDVAKMLVETAGDALMDTSSFPPVINSTLNDRGAEQPLNYSRASARNSVDSGIIYSNSHYSPMDTNLDGSSKDLFTDLRLSSSSLDSGEPTLNTVSLSPATPPRPKPYLQSTFRPHPSPRSTHNHLVKSASQELLSTSDNSTTGNHQMDNKLGWLDLTLGSAVGGPPSPGGPFGNMNFEEGHPQHNRYHQAMSYNAFHENESILGVGGSTGALNINPGLGGNGVEQWDPWDGILESNFNT
uniref:MKL/myocardin-like protein 2 n=1 Tax=Phallusia mammillata TaxID=59560 RepID=A0A6F9DLJ6_9ASCI|nr:MKL/myocardin-like protein 2 [Phallusia mammillata]